MYKRQELNKEDQAKYIGVQGAFYNVAKLVANGGLVAMAGALAEHFGAIEGASIDANKGAYSSASVSYTHLRRFRIICLR